MMKKVCAVMTSVAMVAGALAGCGSTQTETKAPEASTAAEESAATPVEGDTAEKTDEVVQEEEIEATILVWGPAEEQSEEHGQWLQTMCEQFAAEHPNWTLTFEYGVCPEGDARTLVTQDPSASGDVYMFANDGINDLIASNAIAELGGETAEYVRSTNSEAIVDSVTVDGSIYGVPFTTNTWFMYYDTSKFTEEEAGNLDAMLAKDKVSFPLNNSWYIASFYVANGCTLFGEDGTDEAAGIDFGGEKAVAVTNYLVDLVANPNFVNDKDGSGIAGLRDGSIGAMFSGSWDYTAAKEALGDNFGAIELPTITIDGEEKQMMSFAGSKAIGVNPNCEYPQVAVALAKYLGSAEAQMSHYELRSVIPCNTELLADPELQADPVVVAQNNTFDNTSIIQPFVQSMGNYWTPAENFGNSLLNKEVTHDNAEDKTEELNASLNSTLAD